MNEYVLFWLNGDKTVVHGTNVADAMNNAGFTSGAVRALDFYDEGDREDEWEFTDDGWKRIPS